VKKNFHSHAIIAFDSEAKILRERDARLIAISQQIAEQRIMKRAAKSV
jgi:hypothetical protein